MAQKKGGATTARTLTINLIKLSDRTSIMLNVNATRRVCVGILYISFFFVCVCFVYCDYRTFCIWAPRR